MVGFIYSGNIFALVGGEDVLSVNWSARLECMLDYGEAWALVQGPHWFGKRKVAEEQGSLGSSKGQAR